MSRREVGRLGVEAGWDGGKAGRDAAACGKGLRRDVSAETWVLSDRSLPEDADQRTRPRCGIAWRKWDRPGACSKGECRGPKGSGGPADMAGPPRAALSTPGLAADQRFGLF